MNISERGKEPWLAVNLSMFFPGIGQIYSGNVRRGIVLIISYILLIGIGGWLMFSPTGDIGIGLVLVLPTIPVNIWNLFDAHRCARKANNRSFEELRKTSKDPWLAVLLSRLLPGMGHIYIGKAWLGILLLIIVIVSSLLPLGSIIASCLITYHAYIAAPGRRKISTSWLVAFFIVLFVLRLGKFAQLPRTYVAEARYIPTDSMLPTLKINDRLIIDKWSYRFEEPQRGDLIVFMPPERAGICVSSSYIPDPSDSWSNLPTDKTKPSNPELQKPFIQRIIGLPGDKVEVKREQVYINNKTLQEKYIAEAPFYEFGPVTVPAKSYLVLGDNRNKSCDSHYWGPVPRENIIGKATKRFWPPKGIGRVE
jgi:signal peptidase I